MRGQQVEKVNAEVVECACIVDLSGLKGRERVVKPVFVLIEEEDGNIA